jgi:hypothetical protein
MPKLVNKPPKYSLHKATGQARARCYNKTNYLGKFQSPESLEAYSRFLASLPKREEDEKPPEPAPGAVLFVREVILHNHTFASRPLGSQPRHRDGVIRAIVNRLERASNSERRRRNLPVDALRAWATFAQDRPQLPDRHRGELPSVARASSTAARE